MREEKGMEKNYLLAIVLSMAILLGYPWLMKWIYPEAPIQNSTVTEQMEEKNPIANPQENLSPGEALKPAEGPFIDARERASVTRFTNQIFDIEFSTLGGTVQRLVFHDPVHHLNGAAEILYSGEITDPGIFGVSFSNETGDLKQTVFRLDKFNQAEGSVEFLYEKPGEYRIRKRFSIENQRPAIWLDVEIENLSGRERHFPTEITNALSYGLETSQAIANVEAVVKAEKMQSKRAEALKKKSFGVTEGVEWAGVIKKYYGILIKPYGKVIASESKTDGGKIVLHQALRLEPLTLQAGERQKQKFLIYAGPQLYETLKEFDADFEALLSKGFWGWLKIWFLIALKFLFRYLHNYGWAILMLTLILKGVFTPLTHISFESMKKMQALQPKIKSMQERHKDNPAKLNKEMMELYKRNRVNPMMGCLPMLLQVPIFIAFYQVLNEAIELKGTPFIWWIKDLAEPDRLFTFSFSLPLIGDAFNLLPVLMLFSMYWQQKLTPQTAATPEQTKMMEFMPLIFGFMFYKMPSGLVLYWFVNNILSIIHQIFIKRMVIALHHEDQ